MVASSRTVDPTQDPAVLAAAEAGAALHERTCLQGIARLSARYRKPVVGVTLLPDPQGRTLWSAGEIGGEHPVLAFPTPERAVRALARLWEYQRFRQRHEG